MSTNPQEIVHPMNAHSADRFMDSIQFDETLESLNGDHAIERNRISNKN
tara:strand:+ start:3427 stop:3573 length:147 start_codon:yes stop_codon:yes gene_type:complete